MERITHKFDNFVCAHDALLRAIRLHEKCQATMSIEELDLLLSMVIKHFELVFETSWKFLKEYLEIKHGYIATSPRAVFRGCFEMRVLPQEVSDELISLVDVRNSTAHTYQIVIARQVGELIETHHELFGQIITLLEPEMQKDGWSA